MTGARIALPLALAVALGVAALTIAPGGFEAESLLAAQDDPAALADRAIAHSIEALEDSALILTVGGEQI